MRIISGKLRGTKLFSLEGKNTRPTLDRVKESLFNIINFKLDNAVILDLFAGSGALSLESLSRGASKAILCDFSKDAVKIIKKNIEKTKLEDNIILYNCTYENALLKSKDNNIKFDIIFLDPPYESDYAVDSIKKIEQYKLLNNEGIVIIETDNKEKIINQLDQSVFEIYDIRKYGRVYLIFIKI